MTSQRTATARSSPPSSAASSSSVSSRRAARTSRWLPAAARAVAAPIPLLAPVINRTGSFSARSAMRAFWQTPDVPARPGGLAIIRRPWIPSRKRKIRLVVALSAAVLLAAALVYTSFSASTEAKEPSQLLSAAPGQELRHDRQGRAAARSATSGHGLHFRVADRDDGRESIPVTYSGTVPDPFRGGREIVLTGEVEQRRLRRRTGHPGDEVPVEVHGDQE